MNDNPLTNDVPRVRFWLLVACAVTFLPASLAVGQSTKRGVGGSEIAQANALNGEWYYNWGNNPSAEILSGGLNGQYTPMIWSANAGNIQARVDNILSYAGALGVDHVLGFNEPDRAEQANMSVADAIALWDVMDHQFASAGIKLVSPASGQAWMDDFMTQANALNLTVDAVALHWYGTPNLNNPTATANGFLSVVDDWHTRYNRPIWITEFAGMDWGVDDISSEDLKAFNEAFLAVVVPGLESRSHVERYAWWQFGRRDVPGEENDTQLISQVDGLWTPTGIGDQYVSSYHEGEQHNLSGTTPGKTNFYLRGGSLVNATGPASVTVASVDAIDGNSDIGGAVDWRVENGVFRVRNNSILRKIGTNKVTITGPTVTNSGEIQLVSGTLALEKGVQLAGPGSVDLASGATLSLGSALDRSGIVINQSMDLDGGVLRINNTIDGVHAINGALTVRSTSTFDGGGTVFINGPILAPSTSIGGGIVKQGSGSVVLTGTNSFTGNTTVAGGTLALVGTADLATSPQIEVQAQATLDISGRIGGAFAITSGRTLNVSGSVIGNTSALSGATISLGDVGALGQTQTVTLTPPSGALGSNSDVRVRSGSNASSNQNDTQALGIGSINATDAFRSLLTFDLSSTGITNPNHIDSVDLTMTLLPPNGAQVNTPSPPTLELLTIGAYNSDTATFNNTPFNAANLVATTTGPNFTSYAAGATIEWSQATSGAFVDAVKNALGSSLHLGARAASLPGTRSFYFIDQSETANAGAAPSLAITYTVPTNPIGSAVFEGDLTLASGSTLEIDLFDTSLFDQLDVNGAASLSGILAIDALDLSQLSINDTFTILTANSIVNNLTLGGPDGGLFNLSASTPTSLVLKYVGAVSLPGDFNGDQVVNAADYTIWRDNFGSPEGALLNGNGTGGVIDQADYNLWTTNFGNVAPSAAVSSAVPEPGAAAVVGLAWMGAYCRRRQGRVFRGHSAVLPHQ